MTEVKNDEVRQSVRNNYKQIALKVINTDNCCAPSFVAHQKKIKLVQWQKSLKS